MAAPQLVPPGPAIGLMPLPSVPGVPAPAPAAGVPAAATPPGPAAPLLGQPGQFALPPQVAPAAPAPGLANPAPQQQMQTPPYAYGTSGPSPPPLGAGRGSPMNPLPPSGPPPPPQQQQQPAPAYHAGPPPGAPGPPPGAPPQLSSSRMPVDKVVDDVAAMGFSRGDVRGVVKQLMDEGRQVDLNVVLDKLMNGAYPR